MRSLRHWTPRYICNRLRDIVYQKRNPEAPWLTPTAVSLLDSYLRPDDFGLEWGSGRSTLWFAKRVANLTSVEHDPGWFRRVQARLRRAQLSGHVEYLYREPSNPDAASPYVRIAEQFPRGTLDFVLVDGIQRSACANAVIDKLRRGGILVLDNANWYLPCRSVSPNSKTEDDGAASDDWRRFLERVAHWRRIWTSSGVTDTAIFFKPPSNDDRADQR